METWIYYMLTRKKQQKIKTLRDRSLKLLNYTAEKYQIQVTDRSA